MHSDTAVDHRAALQHEFILPVSADWTTFGTGGGIEAFVNTFLRYAEVRGLSVTVLCSGPRESRVGSVHFVPIMTAASSEKVFARRLRQHVVRRAFPLTDRTVVLANAAQYVWALRGINVPIVLLSHAAPPRILRLRHSWAFVRLFQLLIEGPAVRHARRIIVANKSIREYYLSRYARLPPSKFVVVPLGVDLSSLEGRPRKDPRTRLALPKTADIILFVGRLSPEKNVGLFISACDALKHDGDSLCAVVVGRGTEEATLRTALATRPWLHWIPQLDHDSDLLDLMAVSRVLAVTSRYETGPLVLVEAIGLGTPVVATDVGRARELLDGRLGMVVGDNPSSFAAGVREALRLSRQDTRAASARIHERIDFQNTMAAIMDALLDPS